MTDPKQSSSNRRGAMKICQLHHRIQGTQKWLAVTADFLIDLMEALIFPITFTACDVCAAQQARPAKGEAIPPTTPEPLVRRSRMEAPQGETATPARALIRGRGLGTEDAEGEEQSASRATTHER